MGLEDLKRHLPRELADAMQALAVLAAGAGGRAFVVGGAVRDALLGLTPLELDMEVFGLASDELRRVLESRWAIDEVGEAFSVLKLRGVAIDVSLPRRERKTGPGHRDFEVEADPDLSLQEAARRRDFTINAMLFDPLAGRLEDPFEGRVDLEHRRLRHTSERFAEDPLRVLRGMQFVARFGLCAEPATVELCRSLDAHHLARERIFEEWRKLLLKGRSISCGLAFLRDCEWLNFFPELAALVDCPQDPEWHPEGDVWQHTLHVMDAFAAERTGDEEEDLVVGLACLCHDLGKPATTRHSDGRLRSIGHESAGEGPTRGLLGRMTLGIDLVEAVVPLVRNHLKPRQLFDAGASDAAVRRLAQRVGRIDRLVRVARADACGRPPLPCTEDTVGEWLLTRAAHLELASTRPRPILQGRHLILRGLVPGPDFGPLLRRAFEAQLDSRFQNLEGAIAYLDQMLGSRTPDGAVSGERVGVSAEIKELPKSS